MLHIMKRKEANWIGHILRRNGLKTHYSKKYRGMDRSDGKTMKKT